MFRTLPLLDSVTSTNEFLKAHIADGIPQAVAARCQTAGKGRFGRTWHSETDQGLYASFLVFPTWKTEEAFLLNQIAILSVVEALNRHVPSGLEVRYKPPNDLYAARGKLSGILVEVGSRAQCLRWAIVGVGINLFQRSFSPQLSQATSLRMEGVAPPSPARLFKSITDSFERHYGSVEAGRDREITQAFNLIPPLESPPEPRKKALP